MKGAAPFPDARVLTNDLNVRLLADSHESIFSAAYWRRLTPLERSCIVCSPPFSCVDLVFAYVEAFATDVAFLHVAEELLFSTVARREWIRERYTQGRLWFVRGLPLGLMRRPCCWLCIARVSGRFHSLVRTVPDGITLIPTWLHDRRRGGGVTLPPSKSL